MTVSKDRKAKGLCNTCANPRLPNRSRCAECAVKQKERQARRRDQRKKTGKCSECGSLPIPGKTLCQRHLDDLTLRRARKIAQGLCLCGSPLKSKNYCVDCLELNRRSKSASIQRKIDVGMCAACGRVPPKPGRFHCVECLYRMQLRKYDMTIADFMKLYNEHDGHCAICESDGDGKSLHIDHDHISGKVRGLLCFKHNAALGFMGDDPERIRKLADYVERLTPRYANVSSSTSL